MRKLSTMTRPILFVAFLLFFVVKVQATCSPETECFGHGEYELITQTCKCYSTHYLSPFESRYGPYSGECCESVNCKTNATCRHGFCGTDGLTCERCQTGWNGSSCDEVTSCFPWLPCKHGSCTKSRFKCACEPGWVGDLCDRSLCAVKCVYGACPHDPKKCECYNNYKSPETGCDRSYCADGWTCLNGGYCIDVHHCVCPPHYSGLYCETISSCSVQCVHGRCTHRPDQCECETNWQGTNCSKYVGPCRNCSSVGGTCYDGPDTCECKPGFMGPQCSVQKCDGCAHGACQLTNHLKHCICDYGWYNQISVPGFDGRFGPCTGINYCAVPCVKGTCPTDPYQCVCTSPYRGTECDVIQCPKCCPPETCDCSDPNHIKCRGRWHHNCCLVKSCFRGDTLVHTEKGLVLIESIKVGDMVVTRHEGDDPSVTYLRRVDQVRKRLISRKDLVVFRMRDEDIWVTPDHPFYDNIKGSWVGAKNVTTSHTLQALKGRTVTLQSHLQASQLLTASDAAELVPVYDLSVDEYDRYSVGKEGLLVSSCNDSSDFLTRDKQVWGAQAHPMFLSTLGGGKNGAELEIVGDPSEADDSPVSASSDPGHLAGIVAGSVLGAMCLLLVAVMVKKYRQRKPYSHIEGYLGDESPRHA